MIIFGREQKFTAASAGKKSGDTQHFRLAVRAVARFSSFLLLFFFLSSSFLLPFFLLSSFLPREHAADNSTSRVRQRQRQRQSGGGGGGERTPLNLPLIFLHLGPVEGASTTSRRVMLRAKTAGLDARVCVVVREKRMCPPPLRPDPLAV
jgi:hypothetical protein